MIDKWTHILLRILFAAACIFAILYAIDRILFFFGWFLPWLPFSASRLIEFVAIALIFVITMLLRQVREELRKLSTKS